MTAPRSLALLVTTLLAGCATAGAAGGPPANPKMAVIGSKGTVVHAIDDSDVRAEGVDASMARFEIAPGRHVVEVGLPGGSPPRLNAAGSNVIAVCFDAVAGRSYRAQPVFNQDRWSPEIIDEDTGGAVQVGCSEQPTAAGAAAPASLPVPSAQLAMRGAQRGPGLTVGLGYFYGGESVVDVMFENAANQSLHAGRGTQLSVGGLWTPLWIDDTVGFGAGASIGWKRHSIEASNGGVTLTRYPLNLGVHGLIPLGDTWFVQLGAGLVKEIAGELYGRGFAAGFDTEVTSTWGLVGDGSIYVRLDRVAVGCGLRYSRLHQRYGGGGVEVDASSLGVVASGQYAF